MTMVMENRLKLKFGTSQMIQHLKDRFNRISIHNIQDAIVAMNISFGFECFSQRKCTLYTHPTRKR